MNNQSRSFRDGCSTCCEPETILSSAKLRLHMHTRLRLHRRKVAARAAQMHGCASCICTSQRRAMLQPHRRKAMAVTMQWCDHIGSWAPRGQLARYGLALALHEGSCSYCAKAVHIGCPIVWLHDFWVVFSDFSPTQARNGSYLGSCLLGKFFLNSGPRFRVG